MRVPRTPLSRRELSLVAAALLVPLPVLALTGFNVPLPNSVARSLGGLVAIEAQDERSSAAIGAAVTPAAAPETRTAPERLAVEPAPSRLPQRLRKTSASSSASPRSHVHSRTGGDADSHHQDSPSENGGGTGSPDPPGEPVPSGGSMPEHAPSPRPEPSAQISVRGEGLGAHTAIAQDGLHVAPDVTDGGAQEPGSAGVVITGVDGSTAGVAVPVPGSGPPLP